MDDELKLRIAKQSAKLFLTQMASVSADVQLMTIDILARTIFATGVKEDKRLKLFDDWIKPIRNEIKGGPRKRTKTDGK